MSETTSGTTQEPVPGVTGTPIEQQVPEVQDHAETAPENTEPASEPEPAPKPRRTDRHIAHLTARAAAAEGARVKAEAERDAALALVRSGQSEDDEQTERRGFTAADLRAEAAKMLAEERAETARMAVVTRGVKELGADVWKEKTDMLASLGATANPAFMQAILDMENTSKLVQTLADDPDLLSEILAKPPAALAAHLGRLDAKLSVPAAAARISQAPAPPRRVAATSVTPDIDLADPKVTMAEWSKAWDEKMPPRLGGRRKTA